VPSFSVDDMLVHLEAESEKSEKPEKPERTVEPEKKSRINEQYAGIFANNYFFKYQ